MEIDLSEFKKNIISWYPFENNQNVLDIENDKEIIDDLKQKSNSVTSVKISEVKNLNDKYDVIVLIGILEKIESQDEFLALLEKCKNLLTKEGKILLAVANKYGMKYLSGDKVNEDTKPYSGIISSDKNSISLFKLKNILENLKVNYKFYYPLPDYKLTNVIYTDCFMPNNDSIDARVLTYCKEGEILNFSEREAYKELMKENKDLFPVFSNSFFIEISEKEKFEDIKYISYSISRKKEYRIKTVIGNEFVYKTATSQLAKEHIETIANNIEILNRNNIECLDKFEKDAIISKYLENSESFDKILMKIYEEQNLDSVIVKIKEFKKEMLDKLQINKEIRKTVFDKYEVSLEENLKEKMHFVYDGVIDLIFQNCLVKENKKYIYDQEWYEENVPVEFILYRALFYFTELKHKEDINIIYEKLELTDYINVFEELENKIQEKIIDKDVWNMHVNSIKDIGNTREILHWYEDRLKAADTQIQNLEMNIESYKKKKDIQIQNIQDCKKNADIHIQNLEIHIENYQKAVRDLNKLVQEKDVELVNYANQLRAISSSLSWKLTKPIRILSWVLNPRSGASFIDRIMPPGGKRRIEYDKKQTEKKYARKVSNYFKLSDEETAEFWKGIDHRKYLKYEKDLERENKGEFSDYEKWIKANAPTDQELEMQTKTKFRKRPKISIVVPLYNTDTEFFRELLYSIHCQTYSNWELCLADGSNEPLEEIISMTKNDKRIKYKFLGENKGISENTNKALELATGDYISLLDHDDMLDISALYEVVKVINENNDVEFIYSDEDKFYFIDTPRYSPHFKPDFAPDTLRSNNYICHFSVFKKSLLEEIGGFNTEYNGAQDFDIILRATEKAKKVIHIPKILYNWRVHKGSTSMDTEAKPYAIEAGRKAVEAHLKRIGLKGIVSNGIHPGTYMVDYDVIGNPKVSIIIPNKDGKDVLKTCIDSVLEKTTYQNYEIVIVENNSETEEIFEYYKELEKNSKIKVIKYEEKGFNYSKIINFGVKNSTGDYIVQLNNDTELITSDWIEKMLGFAQREDVGAVGVRLYYPDETTQHAGIIVGCLQVAAHVFRGLPKENNGYFGREKLIQNMNAVTAACIMTKKSIYEEVGYMNEKFAVAFNDIDFCLKIRETGKLIIYNPRVEFIHYESKTRGNDMDPDKIERFQREINLFLETWKDKLAAGDEYYNKNLSIDTDQYDIKTDKVN